MIDERLDAILEAVGAIKTAAENKQDRLTIDGTVIEDSTNPVQGGAVYDAIADVEDRIGDQIAADIATSVDDELDEMSTRAVQNRVIYSALENKQNKLTIDTELSATSTNPIQNKSIKTALDNKQDTMTVDAALDLTNVASTNPIQNKAVSARFNADNLRFSTLSTSINGKQDKLESGRNIKTINGEPILGEGDITIQSGGGEEINSWADVQRIVRSGKARDYFTVGVDQLQCEHDEHGLLTWDIIGFNKDIAVDENNNIIYQDSVLNKYETKLQGDGTTVQFYIFDRPKSIDRVVVNDVELTDTTDYVYSDTAFTLTFTTAPEQGVTVSVEYKTRLMPTMTLLLHECLPVPSRGTGLSWSQMSFRYDLNSIDDQGNLVNSGFLYGLDSDLKNLLVRAKKSTVEGSIDVTTLYDKVYIPSAYEVYGLSPDKGQTYYEYFKSFSESSVPTEDADGCRIKKESGNSVRWWLRDWFSTGSKLRYVHTNGALHYYYQRWTTYANTVGDQNFSGYLCPLVVIGG